LKKSSFIILLILFLVNQNFAQKKSDSIVLQAKVWNKDSNKNISYSDWKTVKAMTVDLLKDFKQNQPIKLNQYGGNISMKFESTGFFYAIKSKERWWVVDPTGAAFVNVAINGVRQGKSSNNEKSFNEKFGTASKWIEETKKIMDETGFNTTGSWSEVETIKSYNANHPKPIVYTTQLSLLGGFSQKKKKKSGNKEYHELAYVLNPEFKTYCIEKTTDLNSSKNDPNLFGHFSDNELPFQENLIIAFLSINDLTDPAYQAAAKWVTEKKIDINNITKDQKELFSGFIANEYYKTVSEAIKLNDPNHMYIGCRLHSSAKNNPFILAAAEQYNDIISMNYYGSWAVTEKNKEQWIQLKKPFIITEFYTKAEDTKMGNTSGAGWIVKTQKERGIHYENFCLTLLQINNCVGWHWFRYQDNDPLDTTADPSNNNSNKGIVDTYYNVYNDLTKSMQQLNTNVYQLIHYFDNKK